MGVLKSVFSQLLLSFSTVYAQSSVQWTAPLPSGYQLLPGDTIKIPLDTIINSPGATFQTASAATTATQISSRMSVQMTMTYTVAGLQRCNLISYYTPTAFYVLCDNRYLFWLSYAANTYSLLTSARTELSATGVLPANQVCTEMEQSAGRVYVFCSDSSNPNSDIYVYQCPPYGVPFLASAQYSICPNAGHLKGLIRAWPYVSPTSVFVAVLYSVTPPIVSNATDQLNFIVCRIPNPATNGVINSAIKTNLATLTQDTTLSGSIRNLTCSGSATEII